MNTEAYNTIIGKTEDKLRKDTSFVRRNYIVYQVAKVIYIAASIASAFAIWIHVHLRAGETFDAAVAVIIASFITLLIAGCQYMIKPFVDDWQAQAHIKGGEHGTMMFVKGLFGVIGIGLGVWLSLNGASKAVDVVRKDTTFENVKLISEDSIARYYDAQIAQINGSIGRAESTTYKKKITAPATKNLTILFTTVNTLQEKKAAELADAKAKNDAMLAEYKDETKINAAGAKGFMGLAEFLIVLCAWMMGLFDKGTKNEAKSLGIQVDQTFPAGRG